MKKSGQQINWLLCKSCKYFIELNNKVDVGICKKFSPMLSKDNKRFTHLQVNNIFSRINPDLCGPDGKFFEKNNNNTQ